MSDYSKSTNFATKDSLATGNPLKVIKGTEIDDEFEAIETAIGTKADTASPTFTGTPAAPTASAGTNTTQIATTAFVTDAISTAVTDPTFGDVTADSVTITNQIELQSGDQTTGDIAKIQTAGRDELVIRASGDAYSTGSAGAGIQLYGNADSEHAGNFVVQTGQDDSGDARLIVSGGSNNASSAGYRTNTDTRVTIGNSIYNYVDDGNDTGMLNLKNPIDCPAIYLKDVNWETEGDLAAAEGESISFGHWDGSTYTWKTRIDSNGTLYVYRPDNSISDTAYLQRWYSDYGSGTENLKAAVQANGDFQSETNSYQGFSDANLKQDIVDAGSQTDDIMALNLKNYRLKSYVAEYGDEAPVHLGVIAQDLEAQGMEKLVNTNEDGVKSVKYSVLYLKAIGALQEAITRIEALEAEVATLKGA
jgi:hypothetical protein